MRNTFNLVTLNVHDESFDVMLDYFELVLIWCLCGSCAMLNWQKKMNPLYFNVHQHYEWNIRIVKQLEILTSKTLYNTNLQLFLVTKLICNYQNIILWIKLLIWNRFWVFLATKDLAMVLPCNLCKTIIIVFHNFASIMTSWHLKHLDYISIFLNVFLYFNVELE